MKPNENAARPLRRRIVTASTSASAVAPLSLPEQRARARWKPPVAPMIANALAVNRGLLERLKGGMYAPDRVHGEEYQVLFNGLFATTEQQIAALELFARVDWE